jgi:hypothetical protein
MTSLSGNKEEGFEVSCFGQHRRRTVRENDWEVDLVVVAIVEHLQHRRVCTRSTIDPLDSTPIAKNRGWYDTEFDMMHI